MNLNKLEHIEPKLYAGQRIYKVIRGDVIECTVQNEKWLSDDCGSYVYRVRSEMGADIIKDSDIEDCGFLDWESAEQLAEKYLLSHDVIRASEMKPIRTVAYSYIAQNTGDKMLAFYSELDNGMVYVKGFYTLAHLQLPDHKDEAIKKFEEQQKIGYQKPIKYNPEFKNMYRIKQKYDWDYAEAEHCYATG